MYDNELKQKKTKIKPRITHRLDLLQVDLESFLVSEMSYLGRKATERVTRGQLILSWGKKGLLNSIKRQAYTSDRDTGEQEPYL